MRLLKRWWSAKSASSEAPSSPTSTETTAPEETEDAPDEGAATGTTPGAEEGEGAGSGQEMDGGDGAYHLLDSSFVSKLQGYQPRRNERRRKRKVWTKGAIFLIIGGLTNTLLGVLSLIWTPFNLLMKERLNMRPGFPPYDWWVEPPDVVLSVYLFNVTNSERFLKGEDSKIHLEEVGPVVYLEKLSHKNVTFHPNGTLTYTAHRHLEYQADASSIGHNDSLVVPNVAVLGITSFLHDASFVTKFGMRVLLKRLRSHPFSHSTVFDYLWNFRDPLLHLGRTFTPFLVPVNNVGLLNLIYMDFVDEVTVYMGPDNEQNFFTMNRFHGQPRFGFWPEEHCDSVENATEGIVYHQRIGRNESLHYFRKTLCRVAPIRYVGELVKDGIDAYRFELPENFFDRDDDPDTDCFAGNEDQPLTSGLSDLSPCFFNFPIAASSPHFLNGDPYLIDSFDGLRPQRDKHSSYIVVEPMTGIPLESWARIQCNLVIREVSGFTENVVKFSNLTFPLFWVEYSQNGLPWNIEYFLYFFVNILPDLQCWLSFIMLICGCGMLTGGISIIVSGKKNSHMNSYKFLDLSPSNTSILSSS